MKGVIAGIVISAVLGIFVALSLSQLGFINVSAATAEPRILRWFLHSTYEKSVARQARTIEPPAQWNSAVQLQRGAKNFAAMCAGCHTPPGMKATAVSMGMNPEPPLAAELAQELSPEERFWVIQNGIRMTGMPGFGASHPDTFDLWSLVAFTEQLPGLSAASYQALVVAGRAAFPSGDGDGHDHRHGNHGQQ